VTLYIEDHPSPEVMRRMRIRDRRQLCGLYTGIPLNDRSVAHSGVLSDAVHIYREGIMHLAMDRRGRVDEDELREQIRLTVLHELGHHHGMDEDELRELGY
jgi:predicted Zn-dependent protease with MMP-like domain